MIIHQSDLKSYFRCGEQHRRQLIGDRSKQLSATAFGSVMHHALHVLERERDLELALATFQHYWHPLHIGEIADPVEIWIGRQSYSTLLSKGLETIRRYWDLKGFDDEEVLALEVPFIVPVIGTYDPETGQPHELAGTIDRLAVRFYQRRPFLCIDDWKTGRKPAYLKHNVQFTAYAYATTCAEFWLGNGDRTEGFGARGADLFKRFGQMGRRGFWINVMGGPDWVDAGERTEREYARFYRAVDHYVAARRAGIFPLNIDGEVCQYCPFEATCPPEAS